MRIHYIANVRLPTEKAHGIQIMQMCEAFAAAGHDVTLLATTRTTQIKEDPFSYYDVRPNFRLVRLRTLDLIQFGFVGFILQSLSFALRAWWYVRRHNAELIYTRDEFPAILLLLSDDPVVYEGHTGRWNRVIRYVWRRSHALVSITQGLKNFWIEHGVPHEKIFVAPDAVAVEKFNVTSTQQEARTRLGLPQNKILVIYTGHLYEWKGAHVLAQTAAMLPSGTVIVFVGGTEQDIAAFKTQFSTSPNVHIVGHKPYQEMPLYLRAADIVVIPNSQYSETSKHFTSPMKLFEYMASGTPIVASDLPSIREVLDERIAEFAQPDNPTSFASAITRVLQDPSRAQQLRQESSARAHRYSWHARAQSIINFVESYVQKTHT